MGFEVFVAEDGGIEIGSTEAHKETVLGEMATPDEEPERKPELDLMYLLKQAGEYELALAREAAQELEFEQVAEDFEMAKAGILERGYRSGAISGKNAAERERAELLYLEDSEEYGKHTVGYLHAKGVRDQTKAYRIALETKLKLMKAWLYSKSGDHV